MSQIVNLTRPPKAPCPICGKAAVVAYRPFCSRRCADRDLHRWLSEGYKVETNETPEAKEDEAES